MQSLKGSLSKTALNIILIKYNLIMKYKNYLIIDCIMFAMCIVLMRLTNFAFIGIIGLAFGILAIYDNKKLESIEGNP